MPRINVKARLKKVGITLYSSKPELINGVVWEIVAAYRYKNKVTHIMLYGNKLSYFHMMIIINEILAQYAYPDRIGKATRGMKQHYYIYRLGDPHCKKYKSVEQAFVDRMSPDFQWSSQK